MDDSDLNLAHAMAHAHSDIGLLPDQRHLNLAGTHPQLIDLHPFDGRRKAGIVEQDPCRGGVKAQVPRQVCRSDEELWRKTTPEDYKLCHVAQGVQWTSRSGWSGRGKSPNPMNTCKKQQNVTAGLWLAVALLLMRVHGGAAAEEADVCPAPDWDTDGTQT